MKKTYKAQKKVLGGPIGDYQELSEQEGGVQVGSNILKGSASMAAAGAALGPAGIIAGAGLGAVLEGTKAILNKNKVDKENDLKVTANNRRDLQMATSGLKTGGEVKGKFKKQSYAEGGKIKGAGTGKSDSISANLEPGGFVFPAEAAEEGMKLGVEYLGWEKGQTASKQSGDEPVKISNGEVYMSKDEADFLRSEMGVNLDKYAPKADKTSKYANAGEIVSKYAGFGAALAGAAGGIAQISKANKNLDKIKQSSGLAAMHANEAAKIEKSADKSIQVAMAEGSSAGAEAMGNFMETAKSAGGAKASDILKNAAMAGKYTGEDKLKRMKELAGLKLSAATEAAKVRTTGAMAEAQLTAEYDKMKEARWLGARASGYKAMGDAVTNATQQALANKKAADDEQSKAENDRIISQKVQAEILKREADAKTAADAKAPAAVVPPEPVDPVSTYDEDGMLQKFQQSKKNGGKIKKYKKLSYAGK